jgi:hypothetical protein
MSASDLEFYRRRARDERQRAQQSQNADVALIHEELARAYEALIEHDSLRPKLSVNFSKSRLQPA